MRTRALVTSFALLALMLWGGLGLFMSSKYPDSTNQVVFLAIWWAAVSFSIIPLAYLAHTRMRRSRNRALALSQASRQGALAGGLAAALMALRFLHVLTSVTAVLLIVGVLLTEILLSLRGR